MNNNEFVQAIKQYVRDSAISGTVQNMIKPPGRRPRQKHVELSNWFNQLSEENQLMVRKALTEAVDSALFGLFCVIDGVRTIEDSPDKGTFELYYVKGQEKKLINNLDDEVLHDEFNFLTQSE